MTKSERRKKNTSGKCDDHAIMIVELFHENLTEPRCNALNCKSFLESAMTLKGFPAKKWCLRLCIDLDISKEYSKAVQNYIPQVSYNAI